MAAPGPARTGTTAAAAQFAVEVSGTAAVIVTGTTAGVRVLAVKIAAASPTRIAPAVMPIAAPFSVAAALVVRPSRYVFLLHIFIGDRNLYLANVCILLQCAEDLGFDFDSADLDTADIDAR